MAEKEKPFTSAELTERLKEIQRERDEQDKESLDSMVKHPRCCILPSPELLKTCSSKGLDETKTIEDFKEMVKWFVEAKVLNTEFYNHLQGSELKEASFKTLMQLAFNNAFAPMRHTGHPEDHELIIWYYTGHGLSKDKLPDALSLPDLIKVKFNEKLNEIAKKYIDEKPKVKGGELCLHHVGFCGLQGLLKPWIACVKSESQNAKGNGKKNKHLVIILDSCHSGILAEELEELNKKKNGPWNEEGCTVTVQAACGPDEVTYGGYFTPCFKFFSENQEKLKEAKEEWDGMTDKDREYFKGIQLPSPKLVTTGNLNEKEIDAPVIFRETQNFKFTLFKDPGFFKFCYIRQFQLEEAEVSVRVLNPITTVNFMKSATFTVIDYKLMKMTRGPYAGAPMGLFLLKDPSKPTEYAVCAHIHFKKDDTSKVGRINLVHHKVPSFGSFLYIEDHDGLSNSQIKRSRHKIPYAEVPNCANPDPKNPAHWDYWDWKTGKISETTDSKIQNEVNNAMNLIKSVSMREPGRG